MIVVAKRRGAIIYSDGHSLFFQNLFVFRKDNKMRDWMGTVTSGQKGQTRGPVSECEAEVRVEVKEVSPSPDGDGGVGWGGGGWR